jgi:hypothetical protein
MYYIDNNTLIATFQYNLETEQFVIKLREGGANKKSKNAKSKRRTKRSKKSKRGTKKTTRKNTRKYRMK